MGTQAIIFILGFLVVLGLYITLIVQVSKRMSDRINAEKFGLMEGVFIGGIIAGVIAMFQPWLFRAYSVGFIVVLFSTLGFILWSHIMPAQPEYDSEE